MKSEKKVIFFGTEELSVHVIQSDNSNLNGKTNIITHIFCMWLAEFKKKHTHKTTVFYSTQNFDGRLRLMRQGFQPLSPIFRHLFLSWNSL